LSFAGQLQAAFAHFFATGDAAMVLPPQAKAELMMGAMQVAVNGIARRADFRLRDAVDGGGIAREFLGYFLIFEKR
jgi:hypothetical protein